MTNELDAKEYLWNSICEKFCVEKLMLKSIKATDANISDLQFLTNTYSNCIAKSFKIITIYAQLAELSQTSELEEEYLKSQLAIVNSLRAELCELFHNAEFKELRTFYLPKASNFNTAL